MNHRARAKEQQTLEERMGHQVENARRERPHAAGHEHVAELRNCRVSQEPFLISVCAMPMVAAKNAVSVPMIATTVSADRRAFKITCERETM